MAGLATGTQGGGSRGRRKRAGINHTEMGDELSWMSGFSSAGGGGGASGLVGTFRRACRRTVPRVLRDEPLKKLFGVMFLVLKGVKAKQGSHPAQVVVSCSPSGSRVYLLLLLALLFVALSLLLSLLELSLVQMNVFFLSTSAAIDIPLILRL